MWWDLERGLEKVSTRLIREHERYAKWVFDENARRRRRSVGSPALLEVQRPPTWDEAPGFNPYLVRAHASSIAHAMTLRLKKGTYTPHAPASFEVGKPDGGRRVVTTFEIADELISYRLLKSLSRKNYSRMSSRAYAYRAGLSPHDALSYALREMGTSHRLFIAEYDFTKFFDRISHDYLRRAMDSLDIVRTPLEEQLIYAFLKMRASTEAIRQEGKIYSGGVGVAQGTSVSLFLANVAATELDRELERLGVGFARYADDTLIWSQDYGRICIAAEALHVAADSIGSPINVVKSNGIRLLVRDENAKTEIEKATSIDYLGHTLGLGNARMSERTVERIKHKINGFVYNNLLRELKAGTQATTQLTGNDRDYVTCVHQIRRYIYGPLGENDVRRFLSGGVPFMSFEGVMAFYPLVNDREQLESLDGWLLNQVWLAMRRRLELLTQHGLPTPMPSGMSRSELVGFKSTSAGTGEEIDLRLPSFTRVSKVVQRATETYGFGVVPGGGSLYAYD